MTNVVREPKDLRCEFICGFDRKGQRHSPLQKVVLINARRECHCEDQNMLIGDSVCAQSSTIERTRTEKKEEGFNLILKWNPLYLIDATP